MDETKEKDYGKERELAIIEVWRESSMPGMFSSGPGFWSRSGSKSCPSQVRTAPAGQVKSGFNRVARSWKLRGLGIVVKGL